jgi:ATP/maltotriose-dependent transcriptional regulator MalT
LSERELEVLQLLARGASNLEIAQELVIAVDTVKRHVRQILSKLGVKDRFQAARQAQALGLLSDK